MLLFVDILIWCYSLAILILLWLLVSKPTGTVFGGVLFDVATLFVLLSYANVLRG